MGIPLFSCGCVFSDHQTGQTIEQKIRLKRFGGRVASEGFEESEPEDDERKRGGPEPAPSVSNEQ